MFEFLIFEIQILYTTSNEQNAKTKVVDLEKLYNIRVDNFFIWIRLGSPTINLNSVEDNTRRKKIHDRHKWVWGAVVREVPREGEVTGSNPAGSEARDFHAKNAQIWEILKICRGGWRTVPTNWEFVATVC